MTIENTDRRDSFPREEAERVARDIVVILTGTTTSGDGSSWTEKAERMITREWLRAWRGGVQAAARVFADFKTTETDERGRMETTQEEVERIAAKFLALIPENCP